MVSGEGQVRSSECVWQFIGCELSTVKWGRERREEKRRERERERFLGEIQCEREVESEKTHRQID